MSVYTPSKTSSKPIIPRTTPIQPIKQTLPAKIPVATPIIPSQTNTPTPASPVIAPPKPASSVVQAAPVIEIPKSSTILTAPQSPPLNIEKEFLNAHLGEIRALLIQNLKYPRNAQRLKMQGEVRISFRLKTDGSVENVEVIQSSGFEILDEDGKALIKNTASQFPKPSKGISISVPLNYLLR